MLRYNSLLGSEQSADLSPEQRVFMKDKDGSERQFVFVKGPLRVVVDNTLDIIGLFLKMIIILFILFYDWNVYRFRS